MIKVNGKYGAKVGNIQVFTKAGAVEAFKKFVRICYNDITMESASVLSDVALDMYAIGFTAAEVEDIEIATISAA